MNAYSHIHTSSLAALCALAVSAGAAAASTIGFTLEISGDINVPTMVLTNDSTSAQLTRFTMTIGNTSQNFDFFLPAPSNPAGGTATPVTPDLANNGVRTDMLDIAFTGFDPVETSTWAVDIDTDNTNNAIDFRTVLFNNGSALNSVLTAFFTGGYMLSFTLPDGPTLSSYSFSASEVVAAPVPLPAALPLLGGGLGLIGLLGWRRRQNGPA